MLSAFGESSLTLPLTSVLDLIPWNYHILQNPLKTCRLFHDTEQESLEAWLALFHSKSKPHLHF